MEQKFLHEIPTGKTAKSFYKQIDKIMQCKETQWLCETQFFNIIFYEELKKKIIQSKLKADVDHVNHYFLKKHL